MYYEIMNFFFQAEDGIRDIGVTGVQTCALPIFPAYLTGGVTTTGPDPVLAVALNGVVGGWARGYPPRFLVPGLDRSFFADRSEERRVGKECRSPWSAYHYKQQHIQSESSYSHYY